MCSIKAYVRIHPTGNDDASSGGGRLFPDESSTEALPTLGHILNFIESWLQ